MENTPGIEDAVTPSRRIGFFDLETQKLSNEVGGWNNKHLMKVSVAVLYEFSTGNFQVYCEGDIPRLLEDLKQLDLVVGFNIVHFDYAVLQAYTPFDFRTLPTFDILSEIKKNLGSRLSLDHLAEQNLGKHKNSNGLQAVQWFREGRWDLLTDYCKMDVILTKDLFFHAVEKGFLAYRDKQERLLRIQTPWSVEEILAQHRHFLSTHRSRRNQNRHDICRSRQQASSADPGNERS